MTTDWGPQYAIALDEVRAEANRARRMFPPFNSAHEAYAVLLEEVDELWDEVKADEFDRMVEEAIQVGAMAIRLIADLRSKRYAEARDE